MPDADTPTLRMPATTAILSYEFAQSRGPGSKELRLSSKHTQSDMLKMVNDMMSRACTGLMTNATLLSGLKVGLHRCIASRMVKGSAESHLMAQMATRSGQALRLNVRECQVNLLCDHVMTLTGIRGGCDAGRVILPMHAAAGIQAGAALGRLFCSRAHRALHVRHLAREPTATFRAQSSQLLPADGPKHHESVHGKN